MFRELLVPAEAFRDLEEFHMAPRSPGHIYQRFTAPQGPERDVYFVCSLRISYWHLHGSHYPLNRGAVQLSGGIPEDGRLSRDQAKPANLATQFDNYLNCLISVRWLQPVIGEIGQVHAVYLSHADLELLRPLIVPALDEPSVLVGANRPAGRFDIPSNRGQEVHQQSHHCIQTCSVRQPG